MIHVEAKDELQVSFHRRHLPWLFETESLIGLEFAHYARLAGQHWDYRCIPSCPVFYVDVGD